jgi:hypothetical protein
LENKQLNTIVTRSIGGDRKSQKALYDLLSPMMLSVAHRYANNKTDAEDIFQESVLNVFDRLQQLRDPEKIAGWAKKVVVHEAIRFYKNYPYPTSFKMKQKRNLCILILFLLPTTISLAQNDSIYSGPPAKKSFFRKQLLPISLITTGSLLNIGTLKYDIKEVFPDTHTPLFIEENFQPGSVIPTNDFVRGQNFASDTIDGSTSFSLVLLKQTKGDKLWEQLYGYPVYGVGFMLHILIMEYRAHNKMVNCPSTSNSL